ncbi:Ros/MucR family transcriptional regulator [Solidesulfovibrio sp.]
MDQKEAMQAALEIVKAQASVRAMSEDEITAMLAKITAGIMGVDMGIGDTAGELQDESLNPKKAIKEASIVCLECGKSFKVITAKHLAHHGLTPKEYKAKYGYKKTQALCAKSLVRERRAKMKDMKLWERRGKKAGEVAAE